MVDALLLKRSLQELHASLGALAVKLIHNGILKRLDERDAGGVLGAALGEDNASALQVRKGALDHLAQLLDQAGQLHIAGWRLEYPGTL